MDVRVTKSKVVGVLNATPDSFFPNSRVKADDTIRHLVEEMVTAGVDILEIGGESTRPGSVSVDEDEELQRIMPVILLIRKITDLPLSLDTRRARVAREAIDAGVSMINDVSALCDDAAMASLIAESGVGVVLMHMKGQPETMQERPYYDDVLQEVTEFLQARAEYALTQGISSEKVILDPGIGFGKRFIDNLQILHHIANLQKLGFPLMVGTSRKKFIGYVLRIGNDILPVDERLAGSLGTVAWAVMHEVDYVRVHDVRETKHLVQMLQAIMDAG